MKNFYRSTGVLIFCLFLLFTASNTWAQTITASKQAPYSHGETVVYEVRT